MVHLDDCGEWRILPSLEMLQFLKRLKLSNMRRVREVLVPPLEELVLDGMPDLQRCSCISVTDMKSTLRVLEIQSCPVLEVFDLLQKGHNYETEHKSWLPNLRKLIMCNCPHLQVQTPLPPSAIFSELLIKEVSTIMPMEGSSMETFKVGKNIRLRVCSHEMMALDENILAFHNLKDIKYLDISLCAKLISILFKGLSQLSSLKGLKIESCTKVFTSDDVLEHTHQDMITGTGAALPSIESLSISYCEITGKWLSLILQHSPTLKELELYDCPQLKLLTMEEKGKIQPNLLPASEASSSGYLDDALRSSVVDGVVRIPLNLRKITIYGCPHLIFDWINEVFTGFTCLQEDEVHRQANRRCLLPQSLGQLVWSGFSQKYLRPCFVGNLTCLRRLEVTSQSLKYLQVDSCTALEELEIGCCEQLVALEGLESLETLRSLVLVENSMLDFLQLNSCTSLERLGICECGSLFTLEGLRSLVNLKHLEIVRSPTEGISIYSQELFPALESLKTDDLSHLKTSFCKGLTCLQSLTLIHLDATRLTDDQERALLLLRSLQKLCFEGCEDLVDLPAGLGGLLSLKTLMIMECDRISCLPKEGLPPSLEKLDIWSCSDELSEGCRSLATSKLEVEIDEEYVD